MLKDYLVFEYDAYYPRGGMSDLHGSYDTLLEAINVAKTIRSDYVDVYSKATGNCLWSKD